MLKLYVITRQDLSAGQQAVQSCHALIEFQVTHPDLTKEWYARSNTLALLSVPDEMELEALARSAEAKWIEVSRFREPDRDNELTAIVLGPQGKRLVQRLSLTLASLPG